MVTPISILYVKKIRNKVEKNVKKGVDMLKISCYYKTPPRKRQVVAVKKAVDKRQNTW